MKTTSTSYKKDCLSCHVPAQATDWIYTAGYPALKLEKGGLASMKAARVLRFGPPNVITNEDVPKPEPGAGQLLVRVKAAGVGHWDALIREGKAQLQPLPLTLGSELSGIIEGIGADVSGFELGDEVYGATNEQFGGAYAEYAVPSARRMAPKPKTLSFIEAASVPIVTVTAWQMLFEYAHVTAGQTVLIHGAAGNVGAYAVRMAKQGGLHVVATAGFADLGYVRGLGADTVVDSKAERFEDSVTAVDVVLDTVGGDTQQRSLRVLKPGGIYRKGQSGQRENLAGLFCWSPVNHITYVEGGATSTQLTRAAVTVSVPLPENA